MDKKVVVCNYKLDTPKIKKGTKVYVRDFGPQTYELQVKLKTRTHGWDVLYMDVRDLENFRLKTMPEANPMYDEFPNFDEKFLNRVFSLAGIETKIPEFEAPAIKTKERMKKRSKIFSGIGDNPVEEIEKPVIMPKVDGKKIVETLARSKNDRLEKYVVSHSCPTCETEGINQYAFDAKISELQYLSKSFYVCHDCGTMYVGTTNNITPPKQGDKVESLRGNVGIVKYVFGEDAEKAEVIFDTENADQHQVKLCNLKIVNPNWELVYIKDDGTLKKPRR